ncbi:hypothetical protein HHX47_DHR5000439 [Lentinula edodes]|nr:hypothetical protein HHX47_DHR5000439 [Lentinula edodes]
MDIDPNIRHSDILNAIISVGHLVPEVPTGDEEQEQYSLPSALDTPVSYPNTLKLPGHPPNRSNPLGPTEPVSVPEFILPFHTRELGEGESSLYSSPDLYGQVSSTSSLTDAIPWTACPEITNGVVIHDVAAPHATSSQAEQYDPKVVEFYNQYGMQGVIASVESYSSPFRTHTGQIPGMGVQHLDPGRSEIQDDLTGPRQRWNDSSNNYWGPGSRPSPDG